MTVEAVGQRGGQEPKGLPLTITLVLAIGGLVLISSATVFALQWNVSRLNTVELIRAVAELVLARIETRVINDLKPAEHQLEFLGQRIEAGDPGLDQRDSLQTLLTGALAGLPQITAVGAWDRDLHRNVAGRWVDGRHIVERRPDRDNPEIQEADRQLEQAEAAFWGELVADEDGPTLINLRRPLRRDGAYIGFLATVIAVPELSAQLEAIGDQFDATAFVLYGRDRVLAHPNLTALSPADRGGDMTLPLNAVGDLVLANLWDARPARGLNPVSDSDISIARLSLGDQRYIALYKEIDDFGAVPWIVGAWFNEQDIGQEIARLRASTVAGLGLVILACLAAFLLGRFIAKPVKEAALGTARVGELDLDHVERLRPSVFRELNEQANAFNRMLGSLQAFETYVPKALVRRLISHGDAAVESQERELTVLFTDLVGFTELSETATASEVADFLNEHFALLGACVEAEDGTIDKFIGDALMAFWGAPDRQSDTASRACRAALAMARAVAADNRRREAEGRPPVGLRIGIHTGAVVVGNIGAPGRINYTIVGDTVNTGQRLEALGKTLGDGAEVTILISEATATQLGENLTPEPAGEVTVKGRQEPVRVFRLRH